MLLQTNVNTKETYNMICFTVIPLHIYYHHSKNFSALFFAADNYLNYYIIGGNPTQVTEYIRFYDKESMR